MAIMMNNDIEWKMVKLGDVCTMPTKTISSNTFETRFYVGTENMLQNCSGIIDNEISISTVRVREYKKDDILMSNIRPYLKKIWFSDKDAGCSTDVNIFRTNGKCFPKYLFHVLCQDDFFNYVNDNAIGTKMPRGDKSLIPNFFIPIPYKNGAPDLETQKQIAQKLGDMDSLIAAKEKLLAKKRNLKVAAMQKLIKNEEGENWKKVKLGEVCKNFTGLTYSPSDIQAGGTLVLRSSNIKNGFLDFSDNVFVKMIIPKRAIVQKDDILVCVRNGSKSLIGKSALITEVADGMAFGAFMTILRATKINQKFLFYLWQSKSISDQIQNSLGATINQITNADIKRYEVSIPYKNEAPDLTEQHRIASILSDMDCEIAASEKEITKLQNLKTAMMQKMFCFGDSDSSSE